MGIYPIQPKGLRVGGAVEEESQKGKGDDDEKQLATRSRRTSAKENEGAPPHRRAPFHLPLASRSSPPIGRFGSPNRIPSIPRSKPSDSSLPRSNSVPRRSICSRIDFIPGGSMEQRAPPTGA